jgi:hypothetical protein
MKCGKNILPRVRQDRRPRWSAVPPGRTAKRSSAVAARGVSRDRREGRPEPEAYRGRRERPDIYKTFIKESEHSPQTGRGLSPAPDTGWCFDAGNLRYKNARPIFFKIAKRLEPLCAVCRRPPSLQKTAFTPVKSACGSRQLGFFIL